MFREQIVRAGDSTVECAMFWDSLANCPEYMVSDHVVSREVYLDVLETLKVRASLSYALSLEILADK